MDYRLPLALCDIAAINVRLNLHSAQVPAWGKSPCFDRSNQVVAESQKDEIPAETTGISKSLMR